MPDQSSAANEHALLQEITAPLATLPEDPVPVSSEADFPLAFRGYDRVAVDAYVRKMSQLVAELQATRSPEAAVRRALERVGEQISGILQRAHDTSAQITTQSRIEAEDRLESARQEAQQITAEAHDRVKDLDAETDRIWAERHRIVEDARDLARQLLALAEDAAQRFPPAPGETSEASAQIKPVFDAEAVQVRESEAEGDDVAAAANGEGEIEAEELSDLQAASDTDATAVMPPQPQHQADNGTSDE
jgi:cell division septum initiation protein DivIVA